MKDISLLKRSRFELFFAVVFCLCLYCRVSSNVIFCNRQKLSEVRTFHAASTHQGNLDRRIPSTENKATDNQVKDGGETKLCIGDLSQARRWNRDGREVNCESYPYGHIPVQRCTFPYSDVMPGLHR